MMMPARTFRGGTGYRYGFNGKENDNEVKGEGNQQDYGLRPYDVRLGRLISIDPLAKKYPWYTPYQFAGNNPIKNIDYLGGQPKDRAGQYQFDMMGNRPKNVAYGDDIIMNDPKLGYLNVRTVYDQTTKQVWFIASHSSNPSQMYYYEANDGNHQALHVERNNGGKGMMTITGGQFTPYVTPEQYDDMMRAKVANKFVDGFSTAIFLGGLAGAAAPVVSTIAPYVASASTQAASTVGNYAAQAASSLARKLVADISIKASLSERLASASADGLMQYINAAPQRGFGWGNISQLNITSIGLSALMPGGNVVAGFGSSALEFNLKKGYVGIGNGKSGTDLLIQGAVNTGGNILGNKLGNLTTNHLKWSGAASEGVGNVIGNGFSNTTQTILDKAQGKKDD